MPELSFPARAKVIQKSEKEFILDRRRSSRIIMKDGYKIQEIAEQIWLHVPDAEVKVWTSGPVCSKTQKFLADNDIILLQES